MDGARFIPLVRQLTTVSPRRSIARLLAASALIGTRTSSPSPPVYARKRKRKCKACRKRNRRRCRNKRKTKSPNIILDCRDGQCPPGSVGVCTANDGFCGPNTWAYCLEKPECGCFVTVEGPEICGNIETFTGCPTESECTTSADCGSETTFCVNLDCCPEGKAACRPLCVTA